MEPKLWEAPFPPPSHAHTKSIYGFCTASRPPTAPAPPSASPSHHGSSLSSSKSAKPSTSLKPSHSLMECPSFPSPIRRRRPPWHHPSATTSSTASSAPLPPTTTSMDASHRRSPHGSPRLPPTPSPSWVSHGFSTIPPPYVVSTPPHHHHRAPLPPATTPMDPSHRRSPHGSPHLPTTPSPEMGLPVY